MTSPLRTYVITDRATREGVRADRLLFLLHGYGATEHDLTAIGPLLDPEGHFLVACARGPVPADGGAAWFEPTPLGPDPTSLLQSLSSLDRALGVAARMPCFCHYLESGVIRTAAPNRGAGRRAEAFDAVALQIMSAVTRTRGTRGAWTTAASGASIDGRGRLAPRMPSGRHASSRGCS